MVLSTGNTFHIYQQKSEWYASSRRVPLYVCIYKGVSFMLPASVAPHGTLSLRNQ
ncbi:hypothetical protein HMPREF0658_0872 [Hoylesella marshii DSM 16973 = JCM 13450]|uniref:Uncharacterized protein n=1 Tax=Hoylesella marshii DSM 16973 = JCM 13450 TaxID=862515 RepID=E0NRS1_9BACT|nr:hypothetical protein HMPREF0658_0872 [Hoylesella marshii DSM 16973 = JCM 13450]